eukprot:166579_1
MALWVDKNAQGEREHKYGGYKEDNELAIDHEVDQPIIKIAVIGATGAGKSQLCNLLCDIPQQFEVNDDPDSCTKEIKSHTFHHRIEGKDLRFQVIDCPGFFDTDTVLSTAKRFFNTVPHQLSVIHENIQKCIDLKNKQISVFLFVVPGVGRLNTDFRKSIEFMRDYFIQKASKHVIYVFSKAKGKTEEDIMRTLRANKRNKKQASTLILDYLMKINNNCVTTECERAGVNFNQMRDKVLRKIYESHRTNGVCEGAVMWNSIQEQQKIINRQTYKYYAAVALTWGLGVGCMGLGYKYSRANGAKVAMLRWAASLRNVSQGEYDQFYKVFCQYYG